MAGGVTRVLERVGLEAGEAERWQRRGREGAVLVGAHVDPARAPAVEALFARCGASSTAAGTWPDEGPGPGL